jgi:ADP-dependent phosphofructokinase/glucokinase
MDAGDWEDLYRYVQGPQPAPVVTGFNANIDQIIPVTAALMGSLARQDGPDFATLHKRLLHSMRYCTADEIFISDRQVFSGFVKFFSDDGSPAIGGQAAIAAIQMRRIGMSPVICAVPAAGPQTREMMLQAGIHPGSFGQETTEHPDIIHLIFEHRPGLVPIADGVVPRSNRLIVSPVHDHSTALIPANGEDSFRKQVAACRHAFLSGYQYLRTEQEFVAAAGQLRRIRAIHPLMRTHVECVSGLEPQVLLLMLRHILTETDSIGLNEHELGMYARVLGEPERQPAADLPIFPVDLVREAIALAQATGAARIHIHTFGFYIAILEGGTIRPELSRDALLFAAKETAKEAGGTGRGLSREGLLAYAAVRETFGPEEARGIFRSENRVVVLVPTYVSQEIRKTTGLGDILSSTAFVADPF